MNTGRIPEIEVVWSTNYDSEGWWSVVTNRRTPKRDRRVVPLTVFERYQAAEREYLVACNAMRDAEQPVPRAARSPSGEGQ